VQVTDLAPADMEEDHSSAIGLDVDSRPGAYLALNSHDNRVRRHSPVPLLCCTSLHTAD
jgi:hypothetical protein